MTVARVSQLPAEVLSTNPATKARVSQLAVEVLRSSPITKVQVSQLAAEVLRANVGGSLTTGRRLVNMICG